MALVVVSGALANKPGNGGAAWTRLSWTLGFARLGYDVVFVEQISPSACMDSRRQPCRVDESANLAYFRQVTSRFGLDATLIVEGCSRTFGRSLDELQDIAGTADLLINISGHLQERALKARFRRRVFIDLDPGYTQFWYADGLALDHLRDHHFYFTVGENIGRPGCTLPTDGIEWRPIRQPVVLDQWPALTAERFAGFTTIASWRGPLGRATRGTTLYGVKAHEFRKFSVLPACSGHRFGIALEIDPADHCDRDALIANGWDVMDPALVVPDPDAFRTYVQQSGAEFSVAQGVYVDTESGWFSDRTTRYLASGRPALVQDTGWSRNYPSGCGLVAFRTPDEAVAGADRIAHDHAHHGRQARAIAEEFFDSNRVLSELLRTVAT